MPRCRPEAGPQEKASVGVRRVAIDTGKVLRTAVAARPRVGSQARSKARDSRSLPEGVPRFESWPTHSDSSVPVASAERTRPFQEMREAGGATRLALALTTTSRSAVRLRPDPSPLVASAER